MAGKKDPLKELPKLDEWKAPWEVDADGKDIPEDEQKIEPARLKKYLHGLLGDKIALRSQVEESTATVDELEQKIAEATDPKKIEELQAQVATAQRERDEAKNNAQKDGGLLALKYEVALDKGLTKVQAKRLLGSTREELEQDAEELLASFGGGSGAEGGDGDTVRKGPKRRVNNGGDPDPDAADGPEKPVDYDKLVAEALGRR